MVLTDVEGAQHSMGIEMSILKRALVQHQEPTLISQLWMFDDSTPWRKHMSVYTYVWHACMSINTDCTDSSRVQGIRKFPEQD